MHDRSGILKHEFWHERWEQDQIGFHQQEINHYLTSHWAELGLPDGAPVFVPLCGKSLDMLWLREQGHPVFGIELSRKAVEAFFHENEIEPSVNETERFVEFSTDQLTLFAGDYFQLTTRDLGQIQAVFDRAALIALPPQMRGGYVSKMAELLSPGAHILLVTMQYPEGTLEGPPFSVEDEEVQALFGEAFSIENKGCWDAQGPRGVAVQETVYLLTRN
jgi:thiopurine S-methyltransferase